MSLKTLPLKTLFIVVPLVSFTLVLLFLLIPRNLPTNISFLPNQPSYTSHMGDVFGQAYFDLFLFHHQFLDFYSILSSKQTFQNSPKTLIMIDYHSDLYVNNDHLDQKFEGPGNWVNPLLANLDEIYWVLPESTLDPSAKAVLWDRQIITTDRAYIDGPSDQTISLDDQGRVSFATPSASTVKKIVLHKRLLKDLPQFSASNKQILLTIDADYFAYNGAEEDQFTFTPQDLTKEQLEQQMTDLVDTLYSKNIHPVMVGCSQSTKYTLEDAQPVIDQFFRYLGLYSKTGSDYLLYYRHDNSPSGRYTDRMGNANVPRGFLSSIRFDLQTIDRLTTHPDNQISLQGSNSEKDGAIKLLMYHQKISAPLASLLLNFLSLNSNHHQGIISLQSYL